MFMYNWRSRGSSVATVTRMQVANNELLFPVGVTYFTLMQCVHVRCESHPSSRVLYTGEYFLRGKLARLWSRQLTPI